MAEEQSTEREMAVERIPESDIIDPWYDDECDDFARQMIRAQTGTIVIRGDELPWFQNRQANRVKYYLTPQKTDSALQTMEVFVRDDVEFSGMHRHQGAVALFALEGKGHSLVDGESHDWEGGDLILLPLKPGGVAHQHFNDNPDGPSRSLALIVNAFRDHLANEMVQLSDSPLWRGSKSDNSEGVPLKRSWADAAHERDDDGTVFGKLFSMRDAFRRRAEEGICVVRGAEKPWEISRHGKVKWLLHPFQDETVMKSLLVYVQEIPPGSRSGKQLNPGGTVQFIMSGEGHSIINDVREDWKAGDCIALPIRTEPITFQHFNDSPTKPVLLVSATPNFVEIFGPDMSSEFEQLESAPEFVERARS